ncbi:hypothetical protein KIW84_070504, partial [Lathyrus oleraceus]
MAPSKQITPKPKTPKKQQQLAPAKKVRAPRKQPPAPAKKVRAPRKQPPAMKANQQQLSPGPGFLFLSFTVKTRVFKRVLADSNNVIFFILNNKLLLIHTVMTTICIAIHLFDPKICQSLCINYLGWLVICLYYSSHIYLRYIYFVDIISDLSDCILIHILSFMDAQEAVQTCILSKRWINVWKKLHTLTLLDYSELSGKLFEHFVFKFLSLRDDQTDIHSILLHPPFLRKECNKLVYHILKYAFSHHVQHLLINFICFKPNCFSFSSSTLKSLELTSDHLISGVISIFPNSLNFPALTTLSLSYFTFFSNEDGCAEPFSTFNMLNTLIIHHCQVLHKRHLCISNAKLENLSITMCYYMISRTYFEIELYAPSL